MLNKSIAYIYRRDKLCTGRHYLEQTLLWVRDIFHIEAAMGSNISAGIIFILVELTQLYAENLGALNALSTFCLLFI